MSDGPLEITLPNDLAGCQALIEQLACTVGELRREKQELELAYDELIQRAFRNRSERYINDPNQLQLDLNGTADAADATEGLAQAVEEAEQPVKAHARRRHARKPRNEALPEHLPRYEVEAPVSEADKHCPRHGERTLIGFDSVETLEFERPKLRIRVTKYPKYTCPGQAACGVASPERPTGLVEGDRYAPSVAAEIITAKYGFHRVQGKAVSEMRGGLSWPGGRTRPQTSPNCGGKEPLWEASGVKGATLIALGGVCEVERK